jgi:hypothetical protein
MKNNIKTKEIIAESMKKTEETVKDEPRMLDESNLNV